VTLTEYADYECPYCQQVQPTLDKLEAEFKRLRERESADALRQVSSSLGHKPS
jgi:hypothetical protein